MLTKSTIFYLIYFFIGVDILIYNLKNIIMKKLFNMFRDYLTNFLFEDEDLSN
jgi:hypothetical protein